MVATQVGRAVCGDADADPAGPRDGSLSLLQTLSRVGHAAVLHSRAHAVRNSGSVHTDSIAHPVKDCTVRYWHRGTDCRISGFGGSAVGLTWALQAASGGAAGAGPANGISPDLSVDATASGLARRRA